MTETSSNEESCEERTAAMQTIGDNQDQDAPAADIVHGRHPWPQPLNASLFDITPLSSRVDRGYIDFTSEEQAQRRRRSRTTLTLNYRAQAYPMVPSHHQRELPAGRCPENSGGNCSYRSSKRRRENPTTKIIDEVLALVEDTDEAVASAS